LDFSKQIEQVNPKIKQSIRFMELVYHEWVGSEALQKCSIGSVLYAAKTSAELGLLVGKVYGQGWIVPYYNSKSRITEAQFQMGYKGLIVLGKRSGYTIFPPQCICRGDKYKIDMANNKITHELDLEKERGEPLLWYVKVKDDTTGNVFFERMTIAEINKRRDTVLSKIQNEQAKKYSPWVAWYEEMCAKTVIKKATKVMAINDEFREAMDKDEFVQEKDITPDVIIDPALSRIEDIVGDRKPPDFSGQVFSDLSSEVAEALIEEEAINRMVDEPVVLSSIDKVKAMQEKALNKNKSLTQEDLDRADKEPLEF